MRRLFAVLIMVALTAPAGAWSSYAQWTSPSVVVYANPTNAPAWLTPDQIATSVQAAMTVWNQAGSNFHFTFGGFTNAGQGYDGQNVISFPTTNPEGNIAFTYSWWDASNHLLDSDVLLYPGFDYVADDQNCAAFGYGVYLVDILAHELGHLAGLNHSDAIDATMHIGYAACSQTQRTLEVDDMLGIQSLYGLSGSVPIPPVIPPPPAATCPDGDTITRTMKNGQIGIWLAAREAEGYALLSTQKVKSQTTITVVCGGA